MKITIIIVFVLILAFAIFVFVMKRRMARMQHYLFAHDIHPNLFFSDPFATIAPLMAPDTQTPGGKEYLRGVWDFAGEHGNDGIKVPPDGLDFQMDVLGHPNSTACFIILPPPLKKPEAYFTAMIFDGPGLALGQPRQLRYFVLEYHGTAKEPSKSIVGEWILKDGAKLKYVSHGDCASPDLATFRERISEIIRISGSQPEPYVEPSFT